MTRSRTTSPGEIAVHFKFTGRDAADLMRMAKESGKQRHGISGFVKSIVLHVIADDRAEHEGAPTR